MVDLFIFADAAEQLARPGAAQIMNISTLFCKQFMNRIISALCTKNRPKFWSGFYLFCYNQFGFDGYHFFVITKVLVFFTVY